MQLNWSLVAADLREKLNMYTEVTNDGTTEKSEIDLWLTFLELNFRL
jgi:hypothetical protein